VNRLALILLLIGLVSVGLAQYDEKDIISQQAYQLMARRQYSEAETLFRQILQRWPDDSNSALQLLQIYMQTSQLDKAESTLNQYRRIIPQNQIVEQEILLLILQGKADQAWQMGQDYLQRSNYNPNTYRVLASYFESRGFFEKTLQLYREARQRLGNAELFRLEMANTALNYRQYDVALDEYLKFLDKNPANLYFINNQCKTILKEDSTRIEVIADLASQGQSQILNELYANLLVFLDRPAQALEIYKKLPVEKLLRFAEEQYSALHDEVAYPAFAWLGGSTSEVLRKNDYLLRLALIDYRNRRYRDAESTLQGIIADSLLLTPQYKLRSDVNLKARKLMADNAIALTGDVEAALQWYQKAKGFSRSPGETQDLDLAIARLRISSGEFSEADRILKGITDKTMVESRDFLAFLTQLMEGNTDVADSLMNEYVIMQPAGKYVNDSIYLMMFVLGLSEADRDVFFYAYRLMMLQNTAAVDSLASLYAQGDDEELLILAVEWAMMLGERDRALQLLDRNWEDGIASEYAALLKLALTTDADQQQRLAREFLISNPNSIFSPKFRQSLSATNYSRPEY
jgi:predicted Zn-dependent protease